LAGSQGLTSNDLRAEVGGALREPADDGLVQLGIRPAGSTPPVQQPAEEGLIQLGIRPA